MEKSTVYFTDFRCPVGTSQLDKLRKLCVAAGIKDIDMDGWHFFARIMQKLLQTCAKSRVVCHF